MTPIDLITPDPKVEAKQRVRKSRKRSSRRSAKQRATPLSVRKVEIQAERQTRWTRGLDWPVVIWIALLHIGALSALFFFTWKGVALMLFLGWFTGAVGITMGFHRCLTHGSFSTHRWVRRALAFIGGLAGEGPAVMWVAVHRKHHEFSDHEGDPHSPREGFWWSHMVWLAPHRGRDNQRRDIERYAPDLLKDPFMRFLDKTFVLWHWVFGAVLFAIGYFGWDLYTACSFVAYGMFLRLIYVLHVTWFVNSATHMWGYRNYETTDDSRNLWWVGLLAYGEGWHNNHHAYQRMARHGHRWWEFDLTYCMIWTLEKLGLVWNVVRDIPGRHQHTH